MHLCYWITERWLLWTCSNIANMKKQLMDLGCSFDWHRVSKQSTFFPCCLSLSYTLELSRLRVLSVLFVMCIFCTTCTLVNCTIILHFLQFYLFLYLSTLFKIFFLLHTCNASDWWCDSWSVGLFDVSCFMRGCSGFLYTFCMYSRKLVHVQWTGTVARDSRSPVSAVL